jgi:threonine/homoserine/homoserine lactone efflux protein
MTVMISCHFNSGLRFDYRQTGRVITIEAELFISLLIFAFIAAITPGPNNVMLTTTGLNFGVRRGIPHLLGICIGFPVMLVLIGLGFGSLFELYPILHQLIKVVGILYLLYLAWKIATTRQVSKSSDKTRPMTFWQAAAFQWVNPKAWVMGSSALAAFTSLDANFLVQVLLVAMAFMLVAFPSAGIWLVFGAGLQHFLRDPGHLKIFNITMAILLIASIVPVVMGMVANYF